MSHASTSLLSRLLPSLPGPSARVYDRVAWAWCAGALITVLCTFRHYGVTWDEAWHLEYGRRISKWYTSGFSDTDALTYRINYLYGGGYDLLGAIFRAIALPMERFTAIHLLGGLVGVLGLVGTWKLGRALAGPRAGLLALVMLTLHPVWWGHMFNNPKDSPFAVAYAWSLYFMVAAIAELPRPSRATLAKLAAAIGLALSVRIAGLILLCFLALVLALFAAHAGWLRRSWAALAAHVRRALTIGAGVTAGAWAVMLIGWPWAQLDPLTRPFVALRRMSSFDAHQRKMPFADEYLWNYEIGWEYLPHYFGFQTPELVLIMLAIGTAWGVAALLRRGGRAELVRPALALLLVGMAIFVPPIYAVYKGSPLYDGYRHFLFVVPPMVALAAVTIEALVGRLRRRWARGIAWAVTMALLVDLLVQMVHLHPQEVVYFNRFIGGVAGAIGRYDTDYYGNTNPEAMKALQAHLWRTERATYLDSVYYYTGCLSGKAMRLHVPGNFRTFKQRQGEQYSDFSVGYLRDRCDRRFPDGRPIFEVVRDGGVLNVVKDLRALPVPYRTEKGARKKLPAPRPAKEPGVPAADKEASG
ncbi:glycosyltransferase family 39 protein [Nannocystis pusilla]|uniref:Glycosyltransferase family 39 protein n=1 Tax=Nannocystis pusilla TaxID=889268 RepID=A0ABS7U1W7_9BACT|nr:glycosyltransferase family 39 protein [Nannocystis pusilla]